MKIIGSKFYGHDSAIFYIDTIKKEIFAISTERVTRIKHDTMDISPVLETYEFTDIDYFIHGYTNFKTGLDGMSITDVVELEQQKAFRKLFRPKYIKDLKVTKKERNTAVLTGLLTRPKVALEYLAKNTRTYRKSFIKRWSDLSIKEQMSRYISQVLSESNIHPKEIGFCDHHLCHAAGAYYFSPFAYKHKTLSLTLDGFGDGYFSKLFIFENDAYEEISQSTSDILDNQHIISIGILYGNFTEAMGLHRNSDEGKVEALAAYAEKSDLLYAQLMDATSISIEGIRFSPDLIRPFYDISFLQAQIKTYGEEVFAASIQAFLEDIVVEYLNLIAERYDVEHLCLSGGVTANIIMSLNIYERTPFTNLYVIPSMGDEGISVGAALLKAVELGEDIKWVNEQYMPYYGNQLSDAEIKDALAFYADEIESEYIGEEWYIPAAKSLAQGKVLALVQGKMEFGPRALGNRSILANPVDPDIREMINLKVKKRPKYQPFCPSILEEDRERLFEKSFPHKHMAIAFRVKEEHQDKIPSAVHVDGTARPQFVEEADNPPYYKLLKELKSHTGYGVVIDTSFNLHGRTIVHTAKDALLDYIDCNIDELYIEGYKITHKK